MWFRFSQLIDIWASTWGNSPGNGNFWLPSICTQQGCSIWRFMFNTLPPTFRTLSILLWQTGIPCVQWPSVYSAELDKLNQIFMECKKLSPADGKIIYDNPKVLKKQVQDSIGTKYGFVVSLAGSRIECLNADTPKYSKKRTEKRHAVVPPTSRRTRKTTRCVCLFRVKFTPLNYIL